MRWSWWLIWLCSALPSYNVPLRARSAQDARQAAAAGSALGPPPMNGITNLKVAMCDVVMVDVGAKIVLPCVTVDGMTEFTKNGIVPSEGIRTKLRFFKTTAYQKDKGVGTESMGNIIKTMATRGQHISDAMRWNSRAIQTRQPFMELPSRRTGKMPSESGVKFPKDMDEALQLSQGELYALLGFYEQPAPGTTTDILIMFLEYIGCEVANEL